MDERDTPSTGCGSRCGCGDLRTPAPAWRHEEHPRRVGAHGGDDDDVACEPGRATGTAAPCRGGDGSETAASCRGGGAPANAASCGPDGASAAASRGLDGTSATTASCRGDTSPAVASCGARATATSCCCDAAPAVASCCGDGSSAAASCGADGSSATASCGADGSSATAASCRGDAAPAVASCCADGSSATAASCCAGATATSWRGDGSPAGARAGCATSPPLTAACCEGAEPALAAATAGAGCCGAASRAPATAGEPARGPGQRLRIPAMDCAVEEQQIRRALEGVAGIRSLRFALSERALRVDADAPAFDAALAAVRRAGFAAEPWPDDDGVAPLPWWRAAGLPRLVAALALAAGAEIAHAFAPGAEWAGLALAAAAVALAGTGLLKKGLRALARRHLNIDALMAVAVVGAFAIGQWPEAAMVMALYAVAEAIEARAVDRARDAIGALMALAPETATLRRGDAWTTVAVAEARVGDTIRVRAGERVPLDALVVAGATSVDQAAVTGESLPVDKAAGDALFAGTLNLGGSVEARVTAPAESSTLANIGRAVERAQAARAPTQRFVDRFAAVYTPAVFALALAVALLGPALAGWAWTTAVYKALVLLVIACPCALVISTPVTLASGLAAAARRGILLKGGAHLESARRVRAVAFDKTGTLTEGRPRLAAWDTIAGDRAASAALAAALAAETDHPVSRAIADGVAAEAATTAAVAPRAVRVLPGRGVEAEDAAGGAVWLGSRRLAAERGALTPAVDAALAVHERQGRGVTLLGDAGGVRALFAVADAPKSTAREAVAALHALGVVPVMLSGDHEAAARAVAAEVGIAEVRAGLLPEDKLAAIEELRRRHGRVAMAGDGINDAPAMARADLGIAMGAAGTDVAVEAADVVVMNDDPRRVAETVRLSRATHAVLVQNIALALGIKAAFLTLALAGDATMWMAVFADMGASLLVVFNGLRLLAHGRAGTSTPGVGAGSPRRRAVI